MTNTVTTYVRDEYSVLADVIMCEPRHMAIKEVINEMQKQHASANINIEKAILQHNQLSAVIQEFGASVHFLPASAFLPEQVFTRDIGFVIDEKLIVSNMGASIRLEETKALADWYERRYGSCFYLKKGTIEGGDVMLSDDLLFIGQSSRTSGEGLEELQQMCPHKQIIPLHFDHRHLHLDCIFNIVASATAIVYEPAFEADSLAAVKQRFNIISVPDEEQARLGTNVFSLGRRHIISLPENMHVNKQLREYGFIVHEVPYDEIIKSGGSFRCTTLPLRRVEKIINKERNVEQ
ncbi:hypothetical protein CHL76_10175 [Marinococcus halophilus]|uniref:Amidinotransferase n=1 Tax=Marinococcus halophilus TaxID=1371 RepID=A0A510Y3W6_MARHA|nr:arginine deiminase family protein [Marinococcus halophilus]OZT80058.1 hypothetical protein CHL76_10175 [Marinococcus halophilus]GEK58018.1 hypothetical protein MHA01_09230 [Marinococcus halophilus]